ncbi:right-handed parallel beta-helix repeat-containing protein [Tessaracoccus rhinocerotis]|uniref:right-handed parallel beta-helix repeat-containing protein n=1 Tax=Tessaracoccus rhinocerotis TaxID=1689449 RepID=UPI00163D9EDA|nr:right-handed parallel beta-helix repeat-containing protein [Tessaracoccus rhinocerotis]
MIDALDVRGSIVVRADNVTIKNSRVTTDARYPIHITSGVTGTLIDHVEVSNAGSNGKGIFFDGGTGTVRYSDIHSAEDGVHIVADGVTLEHNYIHDLTRFAGAHPDTIQIRGGDNITVRHNNLQAYTASIGVMNAAIQIGSLAGGDTITNLRVTDNLMNGGHVTVNGGGRGEVDSAIYSNNRFGRAHQYSVQANVQNSVWEASNVYDDNGQPAR